MAKINLGVGQLNRNSYSRATLPLRSICSMSMDGSVRGKGRRESPSTARETTAGPRSQPEGREVSQALRDELQPRSYPEETDFAAD